VITFKEIEMLVAKNGLTHSELLGRLESSYGEQEPCRSIMLDWDWFASFE
jgi:hypothetical protein